MYVYARINKETMKFIRETKAITLDYVSRITKYSSSKIELWENSDTDKFPTIMKNHDMDFMKVKAAFVTHMHSDHAIDIPEYMELCCWCDGERYLYLPEGKEDTEKWNYALHGEELYESGGCRIETVKKVVEKLVSMVG